MPALGLRSTVATLSIDLVTAEVAGALLSAGIPTTLLKGPSIARWLYSEDGARPYVDTDLLVEPSRLGDARRVLEDLGFVDDLAGAPQNESDGALWARPDGDPLGRSPGVVDLHISLPGLEMPAQHAWPLLVMDPARMRVAGLDVEVLGEVPRALHLALHAAKNGIDLPKPREDLARGLALLPPETWEAAARLAGILNAEPVFAAGLRLLPEGARLADRLALPVQAPAEYLLRSRARPPLAIAFAIYMSLPGARARARYLAGKLWPRPGVLADRYPYATRGSRELLRARLMWWARIIRWLPVGLRSWLGARREARR